jgi:hypothetical protein
VGCKRGRFASPSVSSAEDNDGETLKTPLETVKFTANLRVRETYGELLPNGTVIDLVAISDRERLGLLFSDGKEKPFISAAIERGGILYHPPSLHPSILEVVPFPGGVAEYGDIAHLFARICNLYQEYLRLPEDSAAFLTTWDMTTWLSESMPAPLTMCIIGGATAHQVFNLFQLSRFLCRRALRVGKLTSRLPFYLRPTLLITDPSLTPQDCAFWSAANFRGVVVPGVGGTLAELGCAKAVLLGPGNSAEAWGAEAMSISLPPREAPDLEDSLLATITGQFQPQLQAYRLDWLHNKAEYITKSYGSSEFALARWLFACMQGEPGIVRVLSPMLRSHEEELMAQRSRDPRVATLEAVWTPSHEQDDLSTGEITKRVNATLWSRGANQDYNVKEIGWKLRHLGLFTSSNGKCKVLRFSGDVRWRIHQCVREFRLKLSFKKDCTDCQAMQAAGEKAVE